MVAVLLSLTLVGGACGGDDNSADNDGGGTTTESGEVHRLRGPRPVGRRPCDTSKPKLSIGLMTVFESPVLSLESHALALEASAEAFNARGGANGSCIEVHACDDGANLDQSVACVREIDEAGVVATVNDLGTAGQAEVSGGHGRGGDPPRSGRTSPTRTGATRTPTRSTPPAPASSS